MYTHDDDDMPRVILLTDDDDDALSASAPSAEEWTEIDVEEFLKRMG